MTTILCDDEQWRSEEHSIEFRMDESYSAIIIHGWIFPIDSIDNDEFCFYSSKTTTKK